MSDSPLWTPPQGHADVAPSRFARREGDGYLTLWSRGEAEFDIGLWCADQRP